jgi:hypothetical protein
MKAGKFKTNKIKKFNRQKTESESLISLNSSLNNKVECDEPPSLSLFATKKTKFITDKTRRIK